MKEGTKRKTNLLLLLVVLTNVATSANIDDLIEAVSKDTTSLWLYKNMFPNLDSLLLDESCLEHGIAIDGKKTVERIQRMVESALKGEDVTMFVLGGSSTLGADLGKDNLKLTYHYALADWWNKTIGSVTGSYMQRKIVAVGGVGTTYFGHCWQEYVNTDEKFDLVTWEFAINDPDSLQYDKAVERFSRDVLSMQSRPGLVFVNFASKGKIASSAVDKCKRHENEARTVDEMAKHYFSTSIRWERSLCACKNLDLKKNIGKLFHNNHPKVIGHAQMAYVLINYFKKSILDGLKKPSTRQLYIGYMDPGGQANMAANGLYSNNAIPSLLPEPVFMTKEDMNSASKCFTSITPGPENPPKHELGSLPVLLNNGFTMLEESPWNSVPEKRYDSTGGYITQNSGSSLRLKFHVPSSNALSMSQISVTVRNKYFGGRVRFVLNDGTANEKIVHADTSEKKKAGTNSIELGQVSAGMQTLSIHTETGGCNLCAIIID
ncbi:uncharacterized protein LOC135692316 isoform X2 [Rhopilema esculentum]|eukprot:gene9133-16795_t